MSDFNVIEIDNDIGTSTVTDEGSGIIAVDVDIKNKGFQFALGKNVKYDFLTEDQALTQDTWVEIYETTTAGKLYSLSLKFLQNTVDIRITIDSVVGSTLDLHEIAHTHGLDSSFEAQLPKYLYTYSTGRGLIIEPPEGGIFDTQFKIEARAVTTTNKLECGLIVRSENT